MCNVSFQKPIIIAHRGLHHQFPENTRESLRAALDAGIEGIEFDLQTTRDGVAVVIHDESLERTTTGTGLIAEKNWSDLADVLVKCSTSRQARLPLLVDIWTDLDDDPSSRGLRLKELVVLAEVKPPNHRRLTLETLSYASKFPGTWIVQSFDEANLIHAAVQSPDADVAFLVDSRETLQRGIDSGWKRIHLSKTFADDPTIAELRAKDRLIGVWTPNSDEELRRVIRLNVDILITDEPLRARELVNEMCV